MIPVVSASVLKFLGDKFESRLSKDSYTYTIPDENGKVKSMARVDLVNPITEIPLAFISSQWVIPSGYDAPKRN